MMKSPPNPNRLNGLRIPVSSERNFFPCSDTFPAAAFVKPPLPFGLRLRFHFRKMTSTGAILQTSDSPLELHPGDSLDFLVTLPAIGSFDVRSSITSIEDGSLCTAGQIHVDWSEPSKPFRLGLAEYLLLGDDRLTPVKLRTAGFLVGDISRVVTFSEANAEEDLEQILRLRLRAHQHEGRLSGFTESELASPFDAHSCHLVSRFGAKIVSYVRLIDVGRDPNKSQYALWGKHQVPDVLWQSGFAEAGAGATDPEFQRSGLFLPLMQFATAIAALKGYRYILGACENDLLSMYSEMGFQLIETREVHPKAGWQFISHLIFLDTHKLLHKPPVGRWVGSMGDAVRYAQNLDSKNNLNSPSPVGQQAVRKPVHFEGGDANGP